ncbi:unknown [Anaerotruncus sp. CAG:390]|nr:unknown [Anaerotruncus sp. CAG:390]
MACKHLRARRVLVKSILNVYPRALKILVERERDAQPRFFRKRKQCGVKAAARCYDLAVVGKFAVGVCRQIGDHAARAGFHIPPKHALKLVGRPSEAYKDKRALDCGTVEQVLGRFPYAGFVFRIAELVLCVHFMLPLCVGYFRFYYIT